MNLTPPNEHLPSRLELVEYTDCTSAEVYDLHLNECPGYDTKHSNGEVPVILELLGMRRTPLLPSLPGPF